jgi:hypothetical protein
VVSQETGPRAIGVLALLALAVPASAGHGIELLRVGPASMSLAPASLQAARAVTGGYPEDLMERLDLISDPEQCATALGTAADAASGRTGIKPARRCRIVAHRNPSDFPPRAPSMKGPSLRCLSGRSVMLFCKLPS